MICDDNGNVAITNDGKYFFFGGGTEENETALETLNREMIEETGYKLKDIKLFDDIISYEYNSSRGYLKINATIYTAKFDEKVCEPIEKIILFYGQNLKNILIICIMNIKKLC